MPNKKKVADNNLQKFRDVVKQKIFGKVYLIFSLIVLIATSAYWSLLGAKIQLSNSDQLVNNFLFSNRATFHGAILPSVHTFLIKWPIFWLMNVFGTTDRVVNIFTVGLVLVTVIILTTIIYRIESRPVVFGTICLAMASVLLMIPAAPYAGALLPVNMAMITTRNIEYILYIVGIILVIRTPKMLSIGFLLSAISLSLLVASDKLFFVFIIGSALIALIIYTRARQWKLVSLSINWFILGLISIAGAYIILALINHSGLTHTTSQGTLSPYNLSSGAKDITLGVIYAVMAIFTNFGANPAYAAITLRSIPHDFFSNLFSFSGPSYLINCLILLFGIYVVFKVVSKTWVHSRGNNASFTKSVRLTILLVWTSVAAILSYVLTKHYYAVDARYLAIIFFTVFVAIASYSRLKKWQPEILVGAGAVFLIGILFGLFGITQNYNRDQAVLAPTNSDNYKVAKALSIHHVNFVIGDYWRVVPIKQVADNLEFKLTKAQVSANISEEKAKGRALNITPFANCLDPDQDQTSSKWMPNLTKTKFAYLLSLTGSLTNYPICTLNQVIAAYGRPNASTLIAGTISKPKEILLFYDSGSHHSSPSSPEPPSGPSTVLPISLDELPYTSCTNPSIMNVVAHEDDDLLFMNPDLYSYIKDKDCVRSIYVTSGNAGIGGDYYWLAREQGVEAAYSYMLGSQDIWIQRIVEIAPDEFITVASPNSDPNISLIFMHLPDGNLNGQGFVSSNYESLQKLQAGSISVLNAVDNQSFYTSQQLIKALSTLMSLYQPSVINTQAGQVGTQYADHSDHIAVDWFATQAYQQFEKDKYNDQVTIPLNHYIGYPVHGMAKNISDAVVQNKLSTFLIYAKYDTHVCQSASTCTQNPAYGAYLTRQYKSTY